MRARPSPCLALPAGATGGPAEALPDVSVERKASDPQQVDNLTNAIIQAFQGNQGSLLTLTTQASVLTQTLAGPDAALGDLIANLDRLMTTLAAQSANLETMLHETSVSIAALKDRNRQLQADIACIGIERIVRGVGRCRLVFAVVGHRIERRIMPGALFFNFLRGNFRRRLLVRADKNVNIQKAIDDWRNIGLGFFGLADALIALGIRYGSQDAQEL